MKRLLYVLMALAWGVQPLFSQDREESFAPVSRADTIFVESDTAVTAGMPWPQSVAVRLGHMLADDMFETSQVGMMVYDLDADSAIFRHNERQLLRPASTMKLITAIAALDRLGGGYQFKTELCYTGEVSGGVLRGDIYCVGGFDPRFNSDDMRAFVESIRRMGVDTIRGTLYADVSMKDSTRFGEGWCWDDDNPVLSPLIVSRRDNFLARFTELLGDAGIVVEANAATGVRPSGAYCICRRFHTMDQILMKMMKDSDNLYAEAMLYQIAASGGNSYVTAADARNVIARLIGKIGLKPSDYRLADGSGLSLYNYVSAELEVAMLRYAFRNNNIYLHLHPSLPQAGFDGTLKSRMRGAFTLGNVYAKTGTLTAISSLAGYCTAANGHRLAFAIINQGLKNGGRGRAFQDRVCELLCQP